MAVQKKGTSKKSKTAKRTKEEIAKSRKISILLFGIGAICFALTWIEGAKIWNFFRNGLFGLFGGSTYLVAPIVIYLAVIIALGRPMVSKLWQTGLSLLLISAFALIFSNASIEGINFFYFVKEVSINGAVGHSGGGLLGVAVGYPLIAICGKPAANIIILIIAAVVIMMLTNTTPVEIYYYFKKRTDVAREKFEEYELEANEKRAIKLQEQAQREEKEEKEWQSKRKTSRDNDINIDFDIDEKPSRRRGRKSGSLIDIPLGTVEGIDIDMAEDVLADYGGPDMPEGINLSAPLRSQSGFEASLGDYDFAKTSQELAENERNYFDDTNIVDRYKETDIFGNPVEVTAGDKDEFGIDINDDIFSNASGVPVSSQLEEVKKEFAFDVDLFGDMEDVTPLQGGSDINSIVPELGSDTVSSSYSTAVAAPIITPITSPMTTIVAGDTSTQFAGSYRYPPLSLFEKSKPVKTSSNEELKANAELLLSTLASFGVQTKLLDICCGPSVIRYELQPASGVKISKITGLADDIALNLAATGVRIEAPIPGKAAVGIEVPNKNSSTVDMHSILSSEVFTKSTSPILIPLGKDIAGEVKLADLSKMPHLLIAGSTGSGKSVCINSIITGIIYRCSPEDARLVLIDPKVVELSDYNGIPHLLMPVVTEPRKASGALGAMVAEMERRYQLFAGNNVRDIKSFNRLSENDETLEKLPYIAIVIDELADLMMTCGKEVEDYICRIAQKARAAGMHLIIATQRPSVDVITGLIKANVPSRIAFAVSSQIDSRTILDGGGAEKLLGMGDMLFMPVGASKPMRIQGTYVKDEEISAVIEYAKQSASPQYDDQLIAEMEKCTAANSSKASATSGADDDHDVMLKSAIETVIDAGMASTSLLQRKLKLGYARAARIMDTMEELHIVGPFEGSKPRAVLATRAEYLEMFANKQDNVEIAQPTEFI